MRITTLVFGLIAAGALAGCVQGDTNRALAGAAAGGLIASATDNNVLAGAAIGGLAGATCDDLNIGLCQ